LVLQHSALFPLPETAPVMSSSQSQMLALGPSQLGCRGWRRERPFWGSGPTRLSSELLGIPKWGPDHKWKGQSSDTAWVALLWAVRSSTDNKYCAASACCQHLKVGQDRGNQCVSFETVRPSAVEKEFWVSKIKLWISCCLAFYTDFLSILLGFIWYCVMGR
jgi:hypothetical protein